MINEEKMTFTIPNEQGIQTEYTILFSFISGKTNKHYMVYTDNSLDSDGSLKVQSCIIHEATDTIEPVTTDEEMQLIQEKLVEYQKELVRLNK